jgi:hypothetical protein
LTRRFFKEDAMIAQLRLSSKPAAMVAVMIAGLAAISFAGQALAQDKPIRVRGEVIAVDGPMMTVKSRDGKELKMKLTDNVSVAAIVPIKITDIKPNSYIGVSAMPQPDGSQKALHVHIFPEPLRGVAEGFGPWDARPGSTMTNATVTETVAGVDGQTINVKYKDGEKKIIVPPNAPIVTYLPGDKSELVPGAKIFIIAAVPQPDGSFTVARVNVGRGVAPPM